MLIVEDDAAVAEAVALPIDAIGYRAILAGSGWQALEALKRESPALMLVDLFLPGMSGSEFLRHVKATPALARIPRFIMTGTNDPMIGVREDAAVFYKPIDLVALVEVVKRYCDRARLQLVARAI